MFNLDGPYWHPVNKSAFILDWDGVLAETDLDFSPIYERFFDGKRVMILEEASKLPEARRELIYKAIYDIEMEGAKRARPVNGSLELISWLESHNIPWAIVSRNTRQCVELAAKVASIKLPSVVITRDDGLLKPDPRVFLKASEMLGKTPFECVAVGDFLYDIVGARRASMRAILVRRANEPWREWADIACNEVFELVDILKNPLPLVPWEYQPVVKQRGLRWLEKAFSLTVRLPKEDFFETIVRLASWGIGGFSVPDGKLEADLWRRFPLLEPKFLWEPLDKAVEGFLKARFPLACVITDDEAKNILVLSGNPGQDLTLVEEQISS